jgi:hypothetical protein
VPDKLKRVAKDRCPIPKMSLRFLANTTPLPESAAA